MLPARFLKPWEVLEMDIQDFHQLSSAGNRYLSVVLDKASKFIFGFPLPTKAAVEVSQELVELVLTFGIPLFMCSDMGGEFMAQVSGGALVQLAESDYQTWSRRLPTKSGSR